MNITNTTIKNNILLFQRSILSQWYGAFKNQNSNFKMNLSSWHSFFYTKPIKENFYIKYDKDYDLYFMEFNCAEQAMMFSKAIIFGDFKTADNILLTLKPDEQKMLGRQVNGFVPEYWDSIKLKLITNINIEKFKQNEELKKQLLETGHLILAEASPWDKIWGIGLGPDDPKAWDVSTWEGENYLGRALMLTREELRK